MHQISAPELSTVDLIDELEARIASILTRTGPVPAAIAPVSAKTRTHPFSRIEEL
jgi:hypothetical protein